MESVLHVCRANDHWEGIARFQNLLGQAETHTSAGAIDVVPRLKERLAQLEALCDVLGRA